MLASVYKYSMSVDIPGSRSIAISEISDFINKNVFFFFLFMLLFELPNDKIIRYQKIGVYVNYFSTIYY